MLKLDVVSPSGQIINKWDIPFLVVPSVKGELTILPGHIDMVCILGKGIMELGEAGRYVIYGGVMEVSKGDTIVVVADKIKKSNDINENQAKNDLKEIESKLTNEVLSDVDFSIINSKYQDLLAELSLFK
ncbi:MAG: ATP synthase F1 subunit epsilon [bacterium]